jgi:hypothetical protein
MNDTPVFISYSHKDEAFKDELERYLAPLRRQGLVRPWSDRQIEPGGDWHEEIRAAVAGAHVAILLVSANFLASEFIMTRELPWLLERRRKSGMVVVPVIFEPCPWRLDASLSLLQALPVDGRPVYDGDSSQAQRHLTAIAERIQALLASSAGAQVVMRKTARADTDPTPLPRSGVWASLKGRLDFWRATEFRRALLQGHRQVDVRPGLSIFEKSLSSIGFQGWRSRPTPSGPRRPTVLVSGPVGVGKTTFLLRLIAEQAAKADLVVRMTGAELSAAMRGPSGDPRPLWRSLYEPFRSRGHPGLTPEAFAHALARRRILIVVEDVHVAGPVAEALEFLCAYLARYQRRVRHQLLLTTREPLTESDTRMPHEPEVIRLEPLKGLEAAEFFWALCTRNGISLDAPDVRQALGDAFQHATTSTPLFVVICAWLVTNVEMHRGNVERMLRMDRARIFGLFIKELYARSLAGSPRGNTGSLLRGYEPFLRAYEQIALQFWPETEEIAVDELDALVGRRVPDGDGWTTDWLIENGFLFRPPDNDRSTLSFPHQAVADYLAAKAMIDAGDFRPLGEMVHATTNLEGFVGFLAELTAAQERRAAHETLFNLARDELSAFVEVARVRPELVRGGDPAWYERLVSASARWATPEAFRHQPAEVWVNLRELFKVLWAPWLDHLCETVRAAGTSSQGVEALAVFGDRRALRLLDDWLGGEAGEELGLESPQYKAFRDAAQSKAVQLVLTKAFDEDGARTARGWNALRLAWASADSALGQAAHSFALKYVPAMGHDFLSQRFAHPLIETAFGSNDAQLRGAVETWVESFVAYQSEENIGRLVALGRPALLAMARGGRYARADQRRQIGLAVASRLGNVLIPPGDYTVIIGGESRLCQVKSALLVPCKPRVVTGPFKRERQALDAVRRQTNLSEENCMNEIQAAIALQHFADEPGRKGVEFLENASVYREVLIGQNQAMGIFTIDNPKQCGQQPDSPALDCDKSLIMKVAFREVEYLHDDSKRGFEYASLRLGN